MCLLGTTFSCGIIHIWCSSEYLQQQDRIMGLVQNKLQCVCMCVCVRCNGKHITQCSIGADICEEYIYTDGSSLWSIKKKY